MRNVVVSRGSESTPRARRRCLAGLVAMAASLIGCDSPAGPGKLDLIPSTWTTFLIEGTVTDVNGLDVAAGTPVTGRISFDPDAPGTFVPGNPSRPTEDPDSVVYRGVAVELGACGAGQSGFLIGQVTRVTRED